MRRAIGIPFAIDWAANDHVKVHLSAARMEGLIARGDRLRIAGS